MSNEYMRIFHTRKIFLLPLELKISIFFKKQFMYLENSKRLKSNNDLYAHLLIA